MGNPKESDLQMLVHILSRLIMNCNVISTTWPGFGEMTTLDPAKM